jgi:N6-L-threonylcarbamoyladenine synthase
LVSGGNTILFAIEADRRIQILATTRDDAAGEALDKGAKLLDLPYPGGPQLERLAQGGDPKAFDFPRAFADDPEPAFSFSGLKTSLRYRLEKCSEAEIEAQKADLAASYQQAAVDALERQTRKALRTDRRYRSLGLSGGVANNRLLRERIQELGSDFDLPVLAARPEHTGDNAAMIAFASWLDPHPSPSPQVRLQVEPSLPLDRLPIGCV